MTEPDLTNVPGDVWVDAIAEAMENRGVSPDAPAVVAVEVLGWAGHLRTLTPERYAALDAFRRENPGDRIGFFARTAAASLCDEHGNLKWTAAQVALMVPQWSDRFARALEAEIVRVNRLPTCRG